MLMGLFTHFTGKMSTPPTPSLYDWSESQIFLLVPIVGGLVFGKCFLPTSNVRRK